MVTRAGLDTSRDFSTGEWSELFPGWPLRTAEEVRQSLGLAAEAPLRLRVVRAPLIDVASRDLRQRVALQRSIRFLVPRAVECYINEKKLYRTE